MSYFVKNGNTFSVTDKASIDLYDALPAGNYIVKFNELTKSFYLEMIEGFNSPPKIYGNISKNVKRIFNTFMERDNSTGVLCTGEKGSGKTLLAKELSVHCFKQNIPTIIINSPHLGETFNKFVQDIDQPAIFLFDEFEKVYDNKEQDFILTLLDGVYPSKKLFILTANDIYRINNHMQNRPGRLYYMLEFGHLDIEFINDYCKENLIDKEHIESILKVSSVFSKFNFDMLQAIVEEVNRYDETPQEALEMLNIKPQNENTDVYDMTLKVGDKLYEKDNLDDCVHRGHPLLASTFYVDYGASEETWKNTIFGQEDLKKVEPVEGTFIFVNEKNDILNLKRRKVKKVNFFSAL